MSDDGSHGRPPAPRRAGAAGFVYSDSAAHAVCGAVIGVGSETRTRRTTLAGGSTPGPTPPPADGGSILRS